MLDLEKVLGVLRESRAKIADESMWMTPARSAMGLCSLGANCAMTALPSLVPFDINAAVAWEAVADAMGLDGPEQIHVFNDSHTHAEVIAAFDSAIATIETDYLESLLRVRIALSSHVAF